MGTIKQIFKEPLLHFIILGGLLFSIYIWLNPNSIENSEEIIVTEGKIMSISRQFSKKWNRAATESELKALIDQYVLTEAYYKEAVKLGLDKNDPAVKRRMRQKMEFFTSDALSLIDVNDVMLQTYMDEHPDKFIKDAIYSFDQIYINPNKHFSELKPYILKIKTQLKEHGTATTDSSMLQEHYEEISASRLNNEFGKNFAKTLVTLKKGEWSEPIQSGLGVHFVKLTHIEPSKTYQLSEVRSAVLRDFMYEKRKELLEIEQKNIVGKYKVKIDLPNIQTSKSE